MFPLFLFIITIFFFETFFFLIFNDFQEKKDDYYVFVFILSFYIFLNSTDRVIFLWEFVYRWSEHKYRYRYLLFYPYPSLPLANPYTLAPPSHTLLLTLFFLMLCDVCFFCPFMFTPFPFSVSVYLSLLSVSLLSPLSLTYPPGLVMRYPEPEPFPCLFIYQVYLLVLMTWRRGVVNRSFL